MRKVEIIVPGRSEGDALSNGLRTLTAAIEKATGEEGGYGLGGPSGYGADYENDVFEMWRYYWGDECSEGCPFVFAEWEADVKHAADCPQRGPPWGKCTCDFHERWQAFQDAHGHPHDPKCGFERPNFRHKATGFTVHWYKWIGRDNKVEVGSCTDVAAMLLECLESINSATN